MKLDRIAVILLFLWPCILTGAPLPKKVTLGMDDFCPYTCLETDHPGFLVELIRLILKKNDIELAITHGSWTRLQMLATEGKVDLLGPLTQYYIEKGNLGSTEQLGGTMRGGFMTRSDSSWSYQGPESLGKLKIAGIKDYSYPSELMQAFDRLKTRGQYMELIGADANRRQVQMLANKRVDVVPALFDTFWYQVYLLKLPAADFRNAGSIALPAAHTHYRIGVLSKDPETRKGLIQILDRGYSELKKDGTLTKILAGYGIKG